MADDTDDKEPRGKAAGGVGRAKSLSPGTRSQIAKDAAAARWRDDLPIAVCGAEDRPLRLADADLQAYVLEDGTRVLSQAGFLAALGRHRKASVRSEERVPAILQGQAIRPFITDDLVEKSRPVAFRTPHGVRASGYRAELLPMVCEVYLRARDAGVVKRHAKVPVLRQRKSPPSARKRPQFAPAKVPAS